MELLMALGGVWGLIVVIVAVLLFLMPIFVFRISNDVSELKAQMVQLNRNLITLVQVTRRAHADRLPPMQCSACKTENPWGRRTCKGCNAILAWE